MADREATRHEAGLRAFAFLAAGLILAGCGSGRPRVVREGGSVGSFRIDATTEREVRAELGSPDRLDTKLDRAVTAPHGGRMLHYRCGRGCDTVYSFNNDTGALSDFETQSSDFVTARGSRVGMSAAKAAELERRRVHAGCGGDQIAIRLDAHHAYVLGVDAGKVVGITYLGPHSVYYDGLC